MTVSNEPLSTDDLLAALSNVQRRKLLASLITDSPPDDAHDPGITVDDVAIYHIHLPKLADCGLIDWDRETNRVTIGPSFEAAEAVLEVLATSNRTPPAEEVEV